VFLFVLGGAISATVVLTSMRACRGGYTALIGGQSWLLFQESIGTCQLFDILSFNICLLALSRLYRAWPSLFLCLVFVFRPLPHSLM